MGDPLFHLYEPIYRVTDYSDVMYDNGMYITISIFSIITVLIGLLTFYKLLDPQPKKLWKYLVVLIAITGLIFGWTSYWIGNDPDIANLINRGEGPTTRFPVTIGLLNACYALVVTFIISILLKRISTNNTNNPF